MKYLFEKLAAVAISTKNYQFIYFFFYWGAGKYIKFSFHHVLLLALPAPFLRQNNQHIFLFIIFSDLKSVQYKYAICFYCYKKQEDYRTCTADELRARLIFVL